MRAWSRIPSTSQTVNNFTGTIMKRVGLPTRRRRQPVLWITNNTKTSPTIPEPLGTPRRVKRRLETYEADHTTSSNWPGAPSMLEIAAMKMKAMSDVSDCINRVPTKTSLFQLQQSRNGCYVQIVPAKRGHEGVVVSGNTLATYDVCRETGPSNLFRPSRKSFIFNTPAKRIVTSFPDSSAQKPKSPITGDRPVMSPAGIAHAGEGALPVASPAVDPASAISPIKKEAVQETTPINARPRRLSETVVELLPVGGPAKAEPSPVKPLSPATSPLNPTGRTAFSPATTRRSSLHMVASPHDFVQASPAATAATPCPKPGRVPVWANPALSSPPKPASPSKLSSPSKLASPSKLPQAAVATPSRPSQMHPTTPRIFTPELTADAGSPLAYVASMFASPTASSPAQSMGTPNKVPDFNFGATSPSFNSASWLQPAEQFPVRNIKKANRRLSEPLLRNCFKSSMRRQTISPQKLVFGSEGAFEQQIVSLPPIAVGEDAASGKASPRPIPKFTLSPAPEQVQSPSKVSRCSRKSVSFSDDKENRVEVLRTKDVLDIDMHENPDIFGPKAAHVTSSPAAPKPLASISERNDSTPAPKHVSRLSSNVASPAVKSPGLAPSSRGKRPSPQESEVNIFDEASHVAPSPAVATPTPASTAESTTPTATPRTSFTPVNEPATAETKPAEIIAASDTYDYDSPGRDYMREFIKRSKPKRPAATETGSPMPVATRRQALATKSLNTDSPGSGKRKQDDVADPLGSPDRSAESRPKRARRDQTESEGKWLKAPLNDEDEDDGDRASPDTEEATVEVELTQDLGGKLSPGRKKKGEIDPAEGVRKALQLFPSNPCVDVNADKRKKLNALTRKYTAHNCGPVERHAILAKLENMEMSPVADPDTRDKAVDWISPISAVLTFEPTTAIHSIQSKVKRAPAKVAIQEPAEDASASQKRRTSPRKGAAKKPLYYKPEPINKAFPKKSALKEPSQAFPVFKGPDLLAEGGLLKASPKKVPSPKKAVTTKVSPKKPAVRKATPAKPTSAKPAVSATTASKKAPATPAKTGIPRARASGIARPVSSRPTNGTPARPRRVTRATS